MNVKLLTIIPTFLLFLGIISHALGQNVGVGTANPAEKLHVAGTFRVDDLQTSLAASAITDKMVWVDANGKVYAFPTGASGKVLGVNGLGILSWLDPGIANSLNNGQIWIGDATNIPIPNTPSGDALLSNTGVITIQDDAVDGTDMTISGESNGSLMYFNGTDWINLGIGLAGQILTISAGVPAWVSPAAAPTTGDLTSSTAGLSITNGTGAVLGIGTTVDVATNALGQNGLVTGPSVANSLQVWGTDVAGNPGWIDPSALIDIDNGLYFNAIAGKIRQGGALVENTTIDEGNFNYLHNLSGTGLFEARNGATTGSGLLVNPSNQVGIGSAIPNSKVEIQSAGNTNASSALHVKNSAANSMLYVQDDGRVGIGATQLTNYYATTKMLLAAQSGRESDLVIRTADSIPFSSIPWIVLQNSRGTLNVPTILPNGSSTGSLFGQGFDGANYLSNAFIDFPIDGATGLNDMPGRITFGTTPDGGANPIERMQINNVGNVGINNTNPTNKLDIVNNPRSGTHPTGLPLYTTTNSNHNSNGVEFRHSNGTQGIGFGFNTIYATGSNASQDLGLQSLGTSGNLLFTTNALERMRVAPSGTVGINTNAPDANVKLHINSGGILMSSNGLSSAFTNLPAAQTDNTDFHLFTRTTRPAPNATASDLRLYIEDDASDAFSIYGNSCVGGGCFDLSKSKQVITFQGDGKIGVNTTAPDGRIDVTGPFYNIANAYKDWSQTSTACFWGTTTFFTQCFTPTQNGVVTRMDVFFQTAPAGTYTLSINGQTAVIVNPANNAINTFTFPTPPPVTGGANTIWSISSTAAYNMYGNCGGGCGNGTGGATYWNEIYIAPTGVLNSNLFVSDVNGLVGVNTKTPSANLDVVGMMRVTGTFVNASDRRLKKDITTIENPLAIVKQLRGVNYYWDKDKFPEKQFSEKAQIGFIAQEVEAVLPQVVSTASDGYKGIEYGNMTAVLVEAVKTQQQQIDAQQQEIQRLRGLLQKIEAVEARLSALDGKTASATSFQMDSPLIAPQNPAPKVQNDLAIPVSSPNIILKSTPTITSTPMSAEQLKLLKQ